MMLDVRGLVGSYAPRSNLNTHTINSGVNVIAQLDLISFLQVCCPA